MGIAECLQENSESKTCPLCPKKVTFADFESLKVHFELCQNERPYRCEQCGLGFGTRDGLTHHQKIHNRGPKSFSCSVCKKKFHSITLLSTHERVHQKPKFICADCGWSFRTKEGLTAHCMKHLGLEPYKCSECQKGFRNPGVRNDHQKRHKVAKPFACADCDKSYVQKHALMKHVLVHLEVRYGCTLKQKNIQQFYCADCEKSYREKQVLMEHVKSAHMGIEYRCNLCEKQFLGWQTLRTHERVVHGPNGSLTHLPDGSSCLCPHCPQRNGFCDSDSLKAHIAFCRVERPFACDGCQLRFTNRDGAVKHHRSVHEKIRFVCADCGKSFQTKWMLTRHLFGPCKWG